MEQGKPVSNHGLWIDPEELKRCSKIVIWEQMLTGGETIGPWTPLLEIPLDTEFLKKISITGTYISLE
ncbi:MAG: hypothetical protein JRJ73_12105 [Deltaproteobacteria bacterium]|nr:hypothetical protein [Deltaproteobacteria bacterium]